MSETFRPQGAECECVMCGCVFTSESTYALHERTATFSCVHPTWVVDAHGRPLLHQFVRRGHPMWQAHRPDLPPLSRVSRENSSVSDSSTANGHGGGEAA